MNPNAEPAPIPLDQLLLARLFRWVLGVFGLRTILVWALLLAALSSTAYGVASLVPDLEAGGLLFSAASLGLLAGWLLARSKLPGWAAAVISACLGAVLIFGRVGQLFVPLGQAGAELGQLAARLLERRFGQPWPSAGPFLQAGGTLVAKTVTLLARIRDWIGGLGGGGPAATEAAFDPVAAILVWSLALWVVSVWAAWAVRRRSQPLLAMLPAAGLLGSSLAFAGASSMYMLPLLAVTLFLLAWVGYARREQLWETSGVDYSVDVHVEIGIAVFGVVVALTALAALSPSLTIRRLSDFFRELRPPVQSPGPSIGRSLGLEPAATPQPVTAINTHIAGGLPRSHLLGTGSELSKEVVMVVQTGELPPEPPGTATTGPQPPRHYWRSITYDRYTGTGWVTSPSFLQSYPAGAALSPGQGPPLGLRLLSQDVQLIDPSLASGGGPDGARMAKPDPSGSLLYTAGELRQVDAGLQAAWRTLPGAGDPPRGDLFGALVPANRYRAESWVSSAGPAELRLAGTNYPQWVRERYLNLPDSVPSRVRALARDLTATEATPYDRAKAIEAYLRTIPYTLEVPLPPASRDVVDYFLFDLKRGYCDYDATAMVVLARAAGLPARLVMGYASGAYDAANARYIVTEADAHSWPEVYFPAYGWIEFEPTGARPVSGLGGAEQPETLPAVPTAATPGLKLDWPRLLGWAGLLLGLAALALLLVETGEPLRLRLLSPDAAIAVLYRRLYRTGRRLALPLHSGDTPYEFTRSLAGRLAALAQRPRWGRFVAPAAGEARRLAELYAQAAYSAHPPGPAEQRQAIHLWGRLRRRLWLARFWRAE